MGARGLVDTTMELLVVPSFTRVGFETRRALFGWRGGDSYRLDGRVIAITGATSGLGLAAATQLARDGATVVAIGRNPDKTARVVEQLRVETANPRVLAVIADLADYESVREAARRIVADHDRLDALIHNAGALSQQRTEAPDGTETTVAGQVVGPFLLTHLLLDRLRASSPGRVITVSSGGMYTAALEVEHLEMNDATYRGSEQYARAKRAQVTLNEEWARRVDRHEVVFHSMHPGWADTPGVEEALPTFRKVVGPLLRDPAAGADTMVWLAADDGEPLAGTGGFWLDRQIRPIHRLRSTRRSDTADRRRELWDWVSQRSGWVCT